MQVITDEYRKLNETLHNTNKHYGTSGHLYAEEVLKICTNIGTKNVLDYGCGKCTLANNLPFQINNYDPSIRAFHEEPEPADIVTCTDVLEHIEPDLLDNVLTHIKSKAKKAVYLAIATRPASKTLADGRNAHLIVKDGTYWFNKVSEFFQVLSFIKKGENVVIIGNPVTIETSQQQGSKHEF